MYSVLFEYLNTESIRVYPSLLRSWQRKLVDRLNEINRVKVLFELPKYIVTSDQVIPAEIIIDMLEWPGSTIYNHHIFAFTHSYSCTHLVTTYQQADSRIYTYTIVDRLVSIGMSGFIDVRLWNSAAILRNCFTETKQRNRLSFST